MKKIPVILDGDPGHDDAIAWLVAGACEAFDIKAITTVAGNQTIEKTTYNAQRIAALLGLDVPVAKGAETPIVGEPIIAPNFHGVSGLDGPALPDPVRDLESRSAVTLMADILREAAEPVTIIATGPETNVARLLLNYPELKEKIALISVMGGGIVRGNWTQAAEFNILEDPEAAHIVFTSGVPLQMCPLDVTERALVKPEEFMRIRNAGGIVAETAAGWLEFFYKFPMQLGYAGAPLHDPCAVLSLVHPEIFTMRKMYVEIDLEGEYSRGATVGDVHNCLHKPANAQVVMDVEREKFLDLLVEAVSWYGKKEVR